MKFSCNTSDLLQALHLVSRAIGNQQALPILGNILMEAEGRRCTVSATDLELSIITHFDARIENEGSITIPAKAILNFAQYNSDPEVLLETNEGTQLRCTSKHAKTVIAGEAASEYPTITAVDRQTSFTLEAEPLLQALHLVTFASAKTTLRPVLSGVFFQITKGKLILVATDSYRLSEYTVQMKGGSDVSCIIPTKILDELRTILSANAKKTEEKESKKDKEKEKSKEEKEPKKGSEIEFFLSKQQIEMHIGSVRLLSRLIDGKFPDYKQILPKDASSKVNFDVHELLTTVKRMHYFAKEVNNNLTFHCEKTQARITTPQTQAGRDEATLSTELSGGESKIALSSSYLLDFLSRIDADSVEMQVTDSLHPAVFVLPKTPQFLHLIMPLRMQEE
jgi:DNA polymerase III subunit beta